MNDIFDRFDYEPIAAASLGTLDFISTVSDSKFVAYFLFFVLFLGIQFNLVIDDILELCMILFAGQVHRARLKGQEVVIKVQRPGLKDLFNIDLKNLRVRFHIGLHVYINFILQFCFCFLTHIFGPRMYPHAMHPMTSRVMGNAWGEI